MTSFRLRIMMQVLPFLLITPGLVLAQAPPSRGAATAALNQPNNPAAASYSRQQIDQMVAPIALYPDQLLTQVLMAATYPPQIVEAARWLEQPGNAELKGDALVAALQPLAWDPSVKGLVAFPQVIGMLSEHIEWTQTLGVAFAAQQPQVMNRVQVLRQMAVKSGGLKQLRHLTVRQEGPAVVIVQAEPDRIYVPVYNPMVMYGAWQDRAYPPVFLPPPRRFVLETIAPGIQVSVGYGIVAPLWGWSRPNWRNQQITINRVEYTRITQNVNVNVQLAPGDGWRRNGPVVLAAPAAVTRAPAAAAMPAGTVAPTAAAAVVSMPQKAASQPTLVQTQKTAAQPAATPGQTPTATAQPGATTQPGQTETKTAKPGTATTAQPGQAQTTPEKPTTAQPGQAQTTTPEPGTAQPGQKKAASSPTGAAQPGHPQAATTESGKAQGTAPGATQPREHAPAASVAKPAGPGVKSDPEQAGVKPPSAAQEPTPRGPERAGAASGAPPTTRHAPEQAGPKPTAGPTQGMAPQGMTAPSAGQAAQRPAPEAARQGSSAPPAGQSAQQPKHEPAGARAPGRPGPDDGDKKER